MADPRTPADRLWEWMADDINCAAALDLLYPGRAVVSLATRLGVSFPGHRIEKIRRKELLAAVRETLRTQPAARRQLARLRGGGHRVGIFVDAMNLSASARDAHGGGVRYSALHERGRELGEVAIARAYVAEHPVPEKQVALEAALRRSGFEVRTLPLRQLPDGRLKANWNLGMATDLMRSAHDLDVVVLGTGTRAKVDPRCLATRVPHHARTTPVRRVSLTTRWWTAPRRTSGRWVGTPRVPVTARCIAGRATSRCGRATRPRDGRGPRAGMPT